MLSEKDKKTIVFALTLSSIFVGWLTMHPGTSLIPVGREEHTWIFDKSFLIFLCGLFYSIVSSITAIATTLVWKPFRRGIQVIVILFSIISFIYSSFWLIAVNLVTHFNP